MSAFEWSLSHFVLSWKRARFTPWYTGLALEGMHIVNFQQPAPLVNGSHRTTWVIITSVIPMRNKTGDAVGLVKRRTAGIQMKICQGLHLTGKLSTICSPSLEIIPTYKTSCKRSWTLLMTSRHKPGVESV